MFSAIYVESNLKQQPRVEQILSRFSETPVIECERYTEVFNKKAQNFRLQKSAPALIIAEKFGHKVLASPGGYGFDDSQSFYFSHMLNCVYDCRYCFLQGMYSSANYVMFANYEDFAAEIVEKIEASNSPTVFYSGYDCDSLALEPVSGFVDFFIPLFKRYPQATLEIRTKSTQIRSLSNLEPISNCVIAMSFTSEKASEKWEHKVPSIDKRIQALRKLQAQGWPVAIRFEPIINQGDVVEDYKNLFAKIFAELDGNKLHSVSTGQFRMPQNYHKKIVSLYPDEPLFALEVKNDDGMISLRSDEQADYLKAIEADLFSYIDKQRYYRCA